MTTLTDAPAAAIGWGADDREQAVALLARVPGLADQSTDRRASVRAWIADLYPPPTQDLPWGDLQPDRLAERFLGRHLHTTPGLADQLTLAADPAQAIRLLTMYTRAVAHPVFTHRLDAALIELCVRHANVLAKPAIRTATQVEAPQPLLAALHRVLSSPDINTKTLQEWGNQPPRTSHALADWAVQLTACLVDNHRRRSNLPGLAMSLNNLSIRFGDLGRREKALEAITEAIQAYRHLTETQPDTFLLDLAASLNNLSIRLGQVGRQEEALETITGAIRHRLAEIRPVVHQKELEWSLAVMEWLRSTIDGDEGTR
ncbi:tetratricopeptide repeat protein [Streptosporangium subroseum]|uniref:tetratricopeptide repeat protein n=1 Tax=Streptosporangium subroseum TaxID=106412 RepID=UPI0015C5E837|nr:tetratricopeptide repeat protein [Streptosporangium subroseum]